MCCQTSCAVYSTCCHARLWNCNVRYDTITIRYWIFLTCRKKLTYSQLSSPHETNRKIESLYVCIFFLFVTIYIQRNKNKSRGMISPITIISLNNIFTARRVYVARTTPWKMSVRPSVCPSHVGVLSKRLNVSSNLFHRRVATPF